MALSWRRTVIWPAVAVAVLALPLTRARADPQPAAGLHVAGSGILNGSGQQVQLHGVNFSGFEYACLYGDLNDGPIPPNQAEVNGMKAWNVNSVRVPLNEDCWLGLHGMDPAASGAVYRTAVANFVQLLTGNGISVILNLHFSGD